ncbi:MAG: hypothetical protein KAJ69_00055 [Thermoplasmatales archaeon]|jgi:predicted N-acetyltransferase YhbS|nr:hypothetical protein [Thermoplasmatales archaeon]
MQRARRNGFRIIRTHVLALNVRFDVFLALELKENYLKNCSGKVEYPKEYFDAL